MYIFSLLLLLLLLQMNHWFRPYIKRNWCCMQMSMQYANHLNEVYTEKLKNGYVLYFD